MVVGPPPAPQLSAAEVRGCPISMLPWASVALFSKDGHLLTEARREHCPKGPSRLHGYRGRSNSY